MTFTTLIVVLFCVLSLFLILIIIVLSFTNRLSRLSLYLSLCLCFFVFFNFQFIYSLNFIKYMSCSGGYPPLKDFKFYVDVDVDNYN